MRTATIFRTSLLAFVLLFAAIGLFLFAPLEPIPPAPPQYIDAAFVRHSESPTGSPEWRIAVTNLTKHPLQIEALRLIETNDSWGYDPGFIPLQKEIGPRSIEMLVVRAPEDRAWRLQVLAWTAPSRMKHRLRKFLPDQMVPEDRRVQREIIIPPND